MAALASWQVAHGVASGDKRGRPSGVVPVAMLARAVRHCAMTWSIHAISLVSSSSVFCAQPVFSVANALISQPLRYSNPSWVAPVQFLKAYWSRLDAPVGL